MLAAAWLLASAWPALAGGAEVVHTIDFTEAPRGGAVEWLEQRGYTLRFDAEDLDPRFTERGLELSTGEQATGLFVRALDLSRAERIRVVWGVERYPKGADWDNGVYRVPIAVQVSFGEEGIDSGSLFVPDAPYFISLFLSKNAQPGKAYTANYYKKGGRYFCDPCTPPPGETVTTTFDLAAAFRREFGQSQVPPITSFSFQMNTDDTRGGAHAYIQRVELLAGKGD